MRKSTFNAVTTALFMLAFHAGAIYTLWHFDLKYFRFAVIVWWFANCPGVGLTFHRLLTHRGFKVPRWLEIILVIISCLALQGSPTLWVATHRKHHQFVDQEKDPHTPRSKYGLAWAQWLWMILPNPSVDNEIIQKFAKDLAKDKFHQVMHKIWWMPSIVFGAILFVIGWPNFDEIIKLIGWGIFVPVAVGWEITWMVNSINHKYGSRRFETEDDSTNNLIIAALTFGEGWHNNHHRYPISARHGYTWFEIIFDLNYQVIYTFKLLGLAKDVKTFEDMPR